MKRITLFLAVATFLAGCHSEAPQREAGELKSKFETAPLSVSSADVKEVDQAAFAAANWTRKSCELLTPEVTDGQKEIKIDSTGQSHLSGYVVDPTDQP